MLFTVDLYYYLTPAHWPKRNLSKYKLPIYQQFVCDGILALYWPIFLVLGFNLVGIVQSAITFIVVVIHMLM